MRRGLIPILLGAALWLAAPVIRAAQDLAIPLEPDSVRFAVIGDFGNGSVQQYEVGKQMAAFQQKSLFTFVITLGDNLYAGEQPRDFARKFEVPYKALLDANVNFYASLGNHDDPNQRFYKPFNMEGNRYYTFKKGNVRFFALDSNYMDRVQLAWLEQELKDSGSDWKIAYFHHPLYASGKHGSQTDLRAVLEPLLVAHGVNVVFAGHEHFYQRIKPQMGITHFVSGAAGQLRRGDLRPSTLTAAGFDRDRSFMLVEIADQAMTFQAISRTGVTVDRGNILRHEGARAVTGE